MPKINRMAAIILCILFCGCAGAFQNYGKFVPDDATEDMFLSYQPSPDYRYYYSGPDAEPNAILGVDKKYNLVTSLWKPVDLTPAQLKSWVELMENGGPSLPPPGQALLDGQGNQVGVWLSYFNGGYVKMLPENGIEVSAPDTSKPYYNLSPYNLEDW